MISIVINCDTRPGCDAEMNTTGDHGEGSLNGVRSWDFLTDGVINKLNFFQGYEVELILYIDEHEGVPKDVQDRMDQITRNLNARIVCRPHQRSHQRWNEMLYLEALKLATGDYVAHFDGDCAAFRCPSWDPGIFYQSLVGMEGIKFVCQPTTMSRAEHGMWWASTRFFFCRRETLNLCELEKCILDEGYRHSVVFSPALEHVLGRMAGGPTGVLYPPANWDDYMIFSWSRYHRELLYMLNGLPYEKVRDYILDCGIHGPNDVISKGLP